MGALTIRIRETPFPTLLTDFVWIGGAPSNGEFL
jgi:hypothetical protein